MHPLRPAAGLAILFIIFGSVALVRAGEKSPLKSASDAVVDAAEDLSSVAEEAARAAEREITGATTTPKKSVRSTEKSDKETVRKGARPAADASAGGADGGKTVRVPESAKQDGPGGAKADGAAPADTKTDAKKGAPPEQAKAADPATAPPAGKDAAAPAQQGSAPQESDAKTPPKPAELTEWPALDIELARARCTRILKDLDVATVPEAPFRKGDCGSPAPVRLVSIGKNPTVTVSPPAVMSCDLVAALHTWVKNDVKPLAKKHLGSEVTSLEVMSDYSCRLAYGRVGNRLSEHGKANALDIRGFVMGSGKTAYVLREWGPTQRDIAAAEELKAAAAQAEAERLAAEKAAAKGKGAGKDAEATKDAAKSGGETAIPKAAGAVGKPDVHPVRPVVKTTVVEAVSKRTAMLANAKSDAAAPAGAREGPTRLGGPKQESGKISGKLGASGETRGGVKTAALHRGPISKGDPSLADKPITKTGQFLRAAHKAACQIFGTTLGPEANEAHRNHFHVDMAERKHRKICD